MTWVAEDDEVLARWLGGALTKNAVRKCPGGYRDRPRPGAQGVPTEAAA